MYYKNVKQLEGIKIVSDSIYESTTSIEEFETLNYNFRSKEIFRAISGMRTFLIYNLKVYSKTVDLIERLVMEHIINSFLFLNSIMINYKYDDNQKNTIIDGTITYALHTLITEVITIIRLQFIVDDKMEKLIGEIIYKYIDTPEIIENNSVTGLLNGTIKNEGYNLHKLITIVPNTLLVINSKETVICSVVFVFMV